MEKMKRRSAWMRIMAIFMAVIMMATMAPVEIMADDHSDQEVFLHDEEVVEDVIVSEDIDEDNEPDGAAISHVPANVKVQITGTETDSNGQKWLVSETRVNKVAYSKYSNRD